MDGLPYLSMKPYYRGFKGKVVKVDEKGISKFITKGKYHIEDDKVIITELPVGYWTHDFKEFLEKTIQMDDSWILDYENHSTDEKVKFIVKVNDETLFDNTYKVKDVIVEKFKLTTPKSTTNIHLYTKDGAIRKYDTIYQVIDDHYYVRLNMYQKRKDHQLETLTKGIQLLESKMRFIESVIEEKIQVYKKSKQSIIDALKSLEFPFYENNCMVDYEEKEITSEYNYLLNLSVYSFTLEKVEELREDILKNKNEFDELEKKDIKDIWKEELNSFEEAYKKM